MKKNKKIITITFILMLILIACTHKTKNPDINSDLSGNILIFYSKDCPNCQAIKKDIYKLINDNDNVLLIDVDKENGEEFINKFGIKKLATAYYVPINKTVDYEYINDNKANLVKKDKNGQKIFNQNEFNRLLEKQQKKE